MTTSVIIPVYQGPRSVVGDRQPVLRDLARCLDALEGQTYRDFEVVVVDDGSDPPIPHLLPRSFAFRQLCIPHGGAPVARNAGARETASALLLFLDADVALHFRALDRMVAALDAHPEASYVYGAFRFGWKRFRCLPFNADRLRAMPYIHTSSLIRRAHFPGFDESLQRFQDWDLWLTMLEQGHGGTYVPEHLYTIRNTRGTMSRWLPAFAYQLPWKGTRARAYDDAAAMIRRKHGLHPT